MVTFDLLGRDAFTERILHSSSQFLPPSISRYIPSIFYLIVPLTIALFIIILLVIILRLRSSWRNKSKSKKKSRAPPTFVWWLKCAALRWVRKSPLFVFRSDRFVCFAHSRSALGSACSVCNSFSSFPCSFLDYPSLILVSHLRVTSRISSKIQFYAHSPSAKSLFNLPAIDSLSTSHLTAILVEYLRVKTDVHICHWINMEYFNVYADICSLFRPWLNCNERMKRWWWKKKKVFASFVQQS